MERGAVPQAEISLLDMAPAADRPVESRPRLDVVSEHVLPEAFRLIEIESDPVAVARRSPGGIDSEEVATLCRRAYVRVAMPPLERCASEAVRRLWDALEAVDSRAIRTFGEHHDRETYFRDKTAWEAVFYEHVRRGLR